MLQLRSVKDFDGYLIGLVFKFHLYATYVDSFVRIVARIFACNLFYILIIGVARS